MVKFGKNKLKALNKLAKKQGNVKGPETNKVLKKKISAAKRITFQKEVLIKEAVSDNALVQNVAKKELFLDELLKTTGRSRKKVTIKTNEDKPTNKPKLKPVKKQKQRQKIQIKDTKLLFNLMKKK